MEPYKLYGQLIWPCTIKEVVCDLKVPLVTFANTPKAIPTLVEWPTTA
jgi:hypothetical protein